MATPNDCSQLVNAKPRPADMHHAVTVGAEERELRELGLVTCGQLANRACVVTLDKAFTALPVALTEVELARLAPKAAVSL